MVFTDKYVLTDKHMLLDKYVLTDKCMLTDKSVLNDKHMLIQCCASHSTDLVTFVRTVRNTIKVHVRSRH